MTVLLVALAILSNFAAVSSSSASEKKRYSVARDIFSQKAPPVYAVDVPPYTAVNVTGDRPMSPSQKAHMMQGLRIRLKEANELLAKGDVASLKSALKSASTLMG